MVRTFKVHEIVGLLDADSVIIGFAGRAGSD